MRLERGRTDGLQEGKEDEIRASERIEARLGLFVFGLHYLDNSVNYF